jgi:hypothetical protein
MIQGEKRRTGRIPEGECIHSVISAMLIHPPVLQARLRLFPRCFALGTKTKPYSSISINSDGFFYCLEPLDPEYKPNAHDITSARRTGCLPYMDRPLTPGPLVCTVRGKCLVLAAGYVRNYLLYVFSLLNSPLSMLFRSTLVLSPLFMFCLAQTMRTSSNLMAQVQTHRGVRQSACDRSKSPLGSS